MFGILFVMLTRQELREMRDLVQRVQSGSVSREDWSHLAALSIISQGEATVAGIAVHSLDEFITVSRPIYEGHAFHHDDFVRMYDRICAAAARYARDLVAH